MGLTKLFNRGIKKAEKKAEDELKARFDAFLKDYKELVDKHKIDITTTLNITERGIMSVLKLIEVPASTEAKEESK